MKRKKKEKKDWYYKKKHSYANFISRQNSTWVKPERCTHHHLQRHGLSERNVIKWKLFPRYWHFVRGIHRSPVNSPHKGQSRGALMFSLISAWINEWVNNREAGDLRRHRDHYDVIVVPRRRQRWWDPVLRHLLGFSKNSMDINDADISIHFSAIDLMLI